MRTIPSLIRDKDVTIYIIQMYVCILQDTAWYWFGKGLAVANLAYFSINLCVFLIPRFLPRAFERYFQERGEIYAKSAEDKRSVSLNKPQLSEKKMD